MSNQNQRYLKFDRINRINGTDRNGTKIRPGGWFSPSMLGRDAVPPRLNFVPFGTDRNLFFNPVNPENPV